MTATYESSMGKRYPLTYAPANWHPCGEAPNGDPYLETEERAERIGYHTAIGRDGNLYVRGLRERVEKLPDGTAIFTDVWHGKQRRFVRDNAVDGKGNWTEDTSAAALAHVEGQVQAQHAKAAPWSLPNGKKLDLKGGRSGVIRQCQGWSTDYRSGNATSLWLHGEPGRGKSQIAAWIAQDVAALGVVVDRHTVPSLNRQMRATYGDVAEEVKHEWIRTVDRLQIVPVLVLEDLSADRAAEDTRKLLYDVLDARMAKNLPTIFTDNKTPDAIEAEGWDPRVASRCRSATLLELKGEDYRAQAKLAF